MELKRYYQISAKHFFPFSAQLIFAALPFFMGVPNLEARECRVASIIIDKKSEFSPEIFSEDSKDEIRKFIPLKVGDPCSVDKLRLTESYLKKWGRFSGIQIISEKKGSDLNLNIILQEGYLVSGIDIYGNYPYLSTRLRRLLTLYSGEIYDAKKADEQREKISSFYERSGYFHTTVSLTSKINEKRKTIDLKYHVHRGKRYKLGPVKVLGNTVFPHSYFTSRLNPLRLYEPIRIRQAIDKIEKDYKDKGYLAARIRLKESSRDDLLQQMNVTLEVLEKKHVDVVFIGNHRVNLRTMKKILPLYTEGGYSDFDLDLSVDALKKYYGKLGYLNPEIHYAKKDEEKKMLVTFFIHEGIQSRVKKINIEGNQIIKDKKIKSKFLSREEGLFQPGYYQPQLIEEDYKKLPQFFHDQGALDAKAIKKEESFSSLNDKALITMTVEEGAVIRVDKIRFEGAHAFSRKKLLGQLKLREKKPFEAQKLQRDIDAITYYYLNRGYPYVKVSYDWERSAEEAVLIIKVEEGDKVHIGDILIVGNERSSVPAIKQSLYLKSGDLFSYQKILESEAELRRTGSFRTVDIETIGLTEKEKTVHLLVKLEELRKIIFDFGVTYDTDNFFTGNASVTNLNVLGTNKRANFTLVGGRDIQKGEVIFRDPYFLGWRMSGALSGKIMRQLQPGFNTTEAGGAFSLLRDFSSKTSLLARYEVTRTFLSHITDPIAAEQNDHTTSRLSLSLSHDERNSFSDPRKGYLAFVGFDFSNHLFASSFSFVQPRAYFVHFLKLGGRLTLMNYFRAEGIEQFDNRLLPRDEKLFLGGDYSLRGFDEDKVGPMRPDGSPSGGRALFMHTAELQLRAFGGFKLAGFMDSGSLTDNLSDLGWDSVRQGGGFGLRYVTPVGPLRLDYGFKLDRKPGEPMGRLHFAFGYAF